MADPIPVWMATPADVAAILRARTKDDTGRELGMWSDATRPTLDEVQQLLDLAAMQTTDVDGPADVCGPLCRNVIAMQAACLVELSYFPEQVRSDRSPYTELKEMLVDARSAFDSCKSSGSPDDPGAGAGYGYHSLPVVPATTEAHYGWRSPEYAATWQQPCFAPTPETPARILEAEPPPEPLEPIVVGHPAEGDVDEGLPPIHTRP